MATQLAKGINLQVYDSGAYHQIPGITVYTDPTVTWSVESTTSHDNTTPVNTLQTTLRDDGKISFTILYDGTNTYHPYLKALSASGAANNFKITYPGSLLGSFEVSCYVTSFAFITDVGGLLKAKFDLSINGAVTDDAPTLLAVTVTDTHAPTYITGNVLELSATYDEIVNVTGSPEIAVTIGSNTRQAVYASGTDTNILKFHYTIVSGDSATATHVSVASPINLNSGTIDDVIGQAGSLTFTPPTTSTYTAN